MLRLKKTWKREKARMGVLSVALRSSNALHRINGIGIFRTPNELFPLLRNCVVCQSIWKEGGGQAVLPAVWLEDYKRRARGRSISSLLLPPVHSAGLLPKGSWLPSPLCSASGLLISIPPAVEGFSTPLIYISLRQATLGGRQ